VTGVNGALADLLRGRECADQRGLDAAMVRADGTADKGRFGANALLAVSLAAARAAAAECGLPLYRYLGGAAAYLLPVPMISVLGGGKRADNSVDFQGLAVLPVGASSFREALRMGAEVHAALRKVLRGRRLGTALGEDGAYLPNLKSNVEALQAAVDAVKEAGYQPGSEVFLAVDAAAGAFFKEGHYVLSGEEVAERSTAQLVDHYAQLCETFPVVSIADGCAPEDWEGWALLGEKLGGKVQLLGDELLAGSAERLAKALKARAVNAALVRPGQCGTVTETLATVEAARRSGLAAVVAAGAGETEDAAVADLAVASGCGQLAAGAVCRSDRVGKYNQLLRIEEELGAGARYAGRSAFPRLG